jgi:multiple sugar transport system ATP-binding protein
MASLDLINVEKSFGPVHILHDISIEMQDGEFLVLVGPSGCGKSTLMNIIAGLEEPTGGMVRLQGRDITHVAPAERNISMVFQSYALYPNMTVAKNIEFPLEMRKVDKASRKERVQSVSKLLQIEHLLDRKPRQLSGGQRQRVAIGRALAREPQLYLFDEPLSNLDAQLRVDMRTEIKKLHQRLKATIVAATAGHPVRGVQQTRQHLCGGVHGFAAHEHSQGQAGRAIWRLDAGSSRQRASAWHANAVAA